MGWIAGYVAFSIVACLLTVAGHDFIAWAHRGITVTIIYAEEINLPGAPDASP